MKRVTLLLHCCCLLFSMDLYSQTFTEITPPGIWSILDMHFWDADHGFVVTDLGLRATTDRGTTWSSPPAPCDPATVFALNQSDLWVGCDNEVLRSTDGGQTWVGSGVLDAVYNGNPYEDPVRWIQMLDTASGYAGIFEGDEMALFKTMDGGGTWLRLPEKVDATFVLGETTNGRDRVLFQDTLRGFASRYDGQIGFFILRTLDGGMSWDTVGQGLGNESFQMLNDSVGFFGLSFKTTDAGATWNQVSTTTTTNHISFLDENRLLAAGYCIQQGVTTFIGRFLHSNNGPGILQENIAYLYCPQQVHLFDSSLAVAVQVDPSFNEAKLVIIDQPLFVGLEDIAEPILELFPNPTNGPAWLRSNSGAIEQVKVWDGTGRLVWENIPLTETVLLDWEGRTAGVYFVGVQVGGDFRTLRLTQAN